MGCGASAPKPAEQYTVTTTAPPAAKPRSASIEPQPAELREEQQANRLINMQVREEKAREENILKLLLLGSGESGKSTIFKQVSQLYNHSYDDPAQRTPYLRIIWQNVLQSMKTMLKQRVVFASDPELASGVQFAAEQEAAAAASAVESASELDTPSPALIQHIKRLWGDEAIQRCYALRARYQLLDTCRFLFEHIDQYARAGYVPSMEDILHTRARTTGIKEMLFEVQGSKFRMLDVGGQKNERKKWIHSFEGVTAVIFVAAISEYDQLLVEDLKTNRLFDALELFAEICNSKWFERTSLILFLNKADLFREKIERVDLRVAFPEYEGGADYDTASAYISKQFLAKNKHGDKKKVYLHVTTATNTENITFTFNAVKDIIIREALQSSGLT